MDRARGLPPEMQDEIARIVLAYPSLDDATSPIAPRFPEGVRRIAARDPASMPGGA